MNYKLFFIPLFLFWTQKLSAQEAIRISGKVTEIKTGEALPYASVLIKSSSIGSVSNENGEFEILVPFSSLSDTLIITYLGYNSVAIKLSPGRHIYHAAMEQKANQLSELIIKPKEPTYYIKEAMKRLEENFPKEPFETEGYYREKFLENGRYIIGSEAVFKSYYPNFTDTLPNQHQLLLYRELGETHEFTFLGAKYKRVNAKGKKKAEKAGKEYSEAKKIQVEFGGPERILGMNFIRDKEDFLDSIQFKKYRYSFGNVLQHLSKNIMTIDFETKGIVGHQKQKGKILLDIHSLAIVGIDYSGEFIIPALVKPILFAMGISVKEARFQKKMQFIEHNQKWYPKEIQAFLFFDVTKKYLFQPNEHSVINIEQIYLARNHKYAKVNKVPDEKRFVTTKKMQEQIFPEGVLSWDDINTIKRH
jgi:hypothetical protein